MTTRTQQPKPPRANTRLTEGPTESTGGPTENRRASGMRRWIPLVAWVGLLALGTSGAQAQGGEQYSFEATLSLGLGGSFNAEPDAGLGNPILQGKFAWRTQPKTLVAVRFGDIDIDSDEQLGRLTEPGLKYITVGGEYRFNELYYTSGVFLGLGMYQLDSSNFETDEGIGLTFGVNGDFPVAQRFSILVELAGHFADLEDADLFGSLTAGLSYHF